MIFNDLSVSGCLSLFTWLLSVGLATLFVTYHLIQVGINGLGFFQSSCPCFGAFYVNNLASLTVACVLVALLLLNRYMSRSPIGNFHFKLKVFFANCLVLTALLLIAGLLSFDGFRLWMGLPTAAIVLSDGGGKVVNLGLVRAGTQVETRFELLNRSNRTVGFIGGGSSCGCVETTPPPKSLPPGGRCAVELSLKVPEKLGRFEPRVEYYIQSPSQYVAPVTFSMVVE